MHYINGAYTNYVNRRRRRNGHLFQGRYKAIVVDRDSYLLELTRYLHLKAWTRYGTEDFLVRRKTEGVLSAAVISMIGD